MAHDGSIVAQAEAFMVSTIKSADTNGRFDLVDHYEGTREDAPARIVEEIFSRASRVALVYASGGVAEDLDADGQLIGTEYEIFVGVANARDAAAARLGEDLGVEGIKAGVHLLREIVTSALHGKHTGASSSTLATEVCQYRGYEEIWFRANQVILSLKVVVPEVPVPD